MSEHDLYRNWRRRLGDEHPDLGPGSYMTNVPAIEVVDGHPFHGCPDCPPENGPDNVYDAGKTHRGACHEHRASWLIGANLFSSWRETTEAEQRERYREIEDYTDVSQSEPLRPDADEAEGDIPF